MEIISTILLETLLKINFNKICGTERSRNVINSQYHVLTFFLAGSKGTPLVQATTRHNNIVYF